jgi:hypothetical protein
MKLIKAAKIIFNSITEDSIDLEEINRKVKSSFGIGWSYTSLFQYLTGKEALLQFDAIGDDYNSDMLTKDKIKIIIGIAHDYCANILPDRTISNGLKVNNFLNSTKIKFKDKLNSLDKRKLN